MEPNGIADELSKLAELRERGVLSDKEFGIQRKQLLNRTNGRSKFSSWTFGVAGALAVAIVLVLTLVPSPTPNKPDAVSLASSTQEASAVAWANSMVGSTLGTTNHEYWYGCLAFVVNAYQVGANYPIRSRVSVTIGENTYPSEVWNHFSGGTTGTDMSPPAGALVFWDSTGGTDDSHVAISIGNGTLISTNVDQPSVPGYNGIHKETMAQFKANSWNIYEGWWLPDGTAVPSAPPVAAAPPPPTTSSTPSAPVSDGSSSPGASSGSAAGTTSSPKPASASGGTSAATPPPNPTPVPVPAPTATSTAAPATPAPPTAPPTYSETVGGVSHTWTNYQDAGGSEGPPIPAYATVQISCKVTGFAVADHNTWWYRIASTPWDNTFYVSADAFYNNGETSGSLVGTPFVDPAVPNC